jgi:signal transduction histidine kinase
MVRRRIVTFLIVILTHYPVFKVYLKKIYQSWLILLGVVGFLLGVVIEVARLLKPDSVERYSLHHPTISVTIFMAICFLYALMAGLIYGHSRLKQVSARILRAQEEERRRLSRELHDGVGQSLLAIKLNLQMMEEKVKKGIPIGRESLQELILEISNSIEEIRQVAMDLRPSILEHIDLISALEWYGKKFQEKSGIQVKIYAEGPIETSLKVKDNLYRIYQEALSNVVKHAKAGLVETTLQVRGRVLSLKITDDGKGFEATRLPGTHQGLGLSTIQERTELLGGIFKVMSSKGKGTTLYLEIPCT